MYIMKQRDFINIPSRVHLNISQSSRVLYPFPMFSQRQTTILQSRQKATPPRNPITQPTVAHYVHASWDYQVVDAEEVFKTVGYGAPIFKKGGSNGVVDEKNAAEMDLNGDQIKFFGTRGEMKEVKGAKISVAVGGVQTIANIKLGNKVAVGDQLAWFSTPNGVVFYSVERAETSQGNRPQAIVAQEIAAQEAGIEAAIRSSPDIANRRILEMTTKFGMMNHCEEIIQAYMKERSELPESGLFGRMVMRGLLGNNNLQGFPEMNDDVWRWALFTYAVEALTRTIDRIVGTVLKIGPRDERRYDVFCDIRV